MFKVTWSKNNILLWLWEKLIDFAKDYYVARLSKLRWYDICKNGFQIDSTVFSSCNIWQSFDRLDYHVSAVWFNIIMSPYQYRNSTMLLGMQGLKLIRTSKRTPGSNSEVYGLKTTPVSHHNIAQHITNHVHNFWLVLLHLTQQKT